jgi:argininosuccinate lyase
MKKQSQSTDSKRTNEDWKGRFRGKLDPEALAFSSSMPVDRRLFREDIEGSIAHLRMLAKQKIVPHGEARLMEKALIRIRKEIERGDFRFEQADSDGRFTAEDIHMAIEQRLTELVGDFGGKLHTARSRNDQIALDERLYLRTTIVGIQNSLRSLQRAVYGTADSNADVVMPGYTHLQRAQPIFLAHHLLAYVAMLDRDYGRFSDCLKRANRSPLGAGALAGTSFPIDRAFVARSLGFEGPVENSIDAVSDRDALVEFLSACAITMMHVSRFAEDCILWSSEEWNFVEFADAFTTGSSIMPQKKNPDMAELVRGKTGRVYGDLIALLTVMKGLPLAYNRDMQEDKEPLFDAADTVRRSLDIFSGLISGARFRKARFEGESDFLLATELADYLVRKGVPFRQAHATVGRIVQECLFQNCLLKELPLTTYRRYSVHFDKDLWKILDLRASLQLKKSAGSTAPSEVKKAFNVWEKILWPKKR